MAATLLTTRKPGRQASEERFLRAFSEAHAELLASLTHQLGSAEDARDALQEAFLKCWRRRKRFSHIRNFRAWIFRVGINAARDLRRNVWRIRSRPLADSPLLDDPTCPAPGETLVRKEVLERLRGALARLRDEEREVFLLRQNSSLTYEEIADRRNVPVGTVKTQMRSALQKLRLVFGGEGL